MQEEKKYLTTIEKYLHGAVYFENTNKGIKPHRFLPEQREAYSLNYMFEIDTKDSAGMCILMDTDSDQLNLCIDVYPMFKHKKEANANATPIWRADEGNDKRTGTLDGIRKCIADIVSQYDNMYVVNGLDAVPHDEAYYEDGMLHPNDSGSEFYANYLVNEVKRIEKR